MPEKRFRIAFSFTGGKRDYVAKVANILADKFGEDKILYDKFHEAEFARNGLSIYLPELYNKDSDLLVVVVCDKYDEKEWTGLEWLAIHDLLQQKQNDAVLLSRFDLATVKGLYGGAAFIELDDKTPEQFTNLILQRLALNEGKSRNYYIRQEDIQRHSTIRHNLPTLQPFFGREEELQKIATALEPSNRTWGALIDGVGGMGKTWLAIRAAYDAPTDAFDRIIYITLKSRELDDDGERDLSGFVISGLQELFNELAKELDRADIAQAVMDQRPRMLLDALRGTRTLLVLDNLESLTKTERDTLFTLIKRLPEGSKAILTSRGRIGSGAEELILKQLDKEAALAALAELGTHNTELAKTTEAERLQLYIETSGKPLLLRWTAGQIGRGHCLTIADAITYLRSCPQGNDPLDFIFGDLAKDFSDAETKTLCALTYFNLPAKAEHIANVAEYDVSEIALALRTLVNRSLVLPSDELQTFTLVPLVANYLHKHRPEVLAETGSRLEKYVYALAIENGYQKHERFPVLDAAWPTIAATLPLLLKGENHRLQHLCTALTTFLDFTGRWDEWLALNIAAEKRAIAADDLQNAGWQAYRAGYIYHLRSQANEVISCADRTSQHWQEVSDVEKASAIQLRGMGHRLAGDYEAAIAAFQQAVEMHRKRHPVSRDVAVGLNILASAKQKSGDYDGAETNYYEALNIAKAIDDKDSLATYTGNLANLALDKSNWLQAETLAREALPLSEAIGRQELIAFYSCCLAKALVMQKQKEEGLPYAERAVAIFRRIGSPNLAWAQKVLKMCEE